MTIPTDPTKLLAEITSIAHEGGLLNMSEADALIAIRRLTKHIYAPPDPWAEEGKTNEPTRTTAE